MKFKSSAVSGHLFKNATSIKNKNRESNETNGHGTVPYSSTTINQHKC